MLQSQADKPQRGSPSSTWKEQQTPVMSTVDQVRVVVCGCKLSSAGLHNEAPPPPKKAKRWEARVPPQTSCVGKRRRTDKKQAGE